MPCPHMQISIVKRSKGKSAITAAAYQSGGRLFSEHDQKIRDYTRKREVAHEEIMLCAHAPPEYADRSTLWNAAEGIEKQWNAQLARKIILAIPREVPKNEYPQMLRDYCTEFFVSKGMCADFAIHDKGDGNPHAHIMLTMHSIDDNGKWLPKCRKEYVLDENGKRIQLPSGEWQSKRVNINDWNEQSNAEIWRQGWADVQNRYLEKCASQLRADLRSYERQGIEQVPTVHMGPAACQLEKKGVRTNLGNLNRDIESTNKLLRRIRNTIRKLKKWIVDLAAERQRLEKEPTLYDRLRQYLEVRRAERAGWSSHAQLTGTVEDYNRLQITLSYMRDNNLVTVEDFQSRLKYCEKSANMLRSQIKATDARLKYLNSIQDAGDRYLQFKPANDEYKKKFFKGAKARYYSEHKSEIDAFNRSLRYLLKNGAELKEGKLKLNMKNPQQEKITLGRENHELGKRLLAVESDLSALRQIRYYLERADTYRPQEPVFGKPEIQQTAVNSTQKQKVKHRDQVEL